MTTLNEAAQQALEALEYANTGNRRPEIIGPAIEALRAALAQQGERKGWKLVPVEATDEMAMAGEKATWIGTINARFAYRAMVAAAPAPQAQLDERATGYTLTHIHTADLDAAQREAAERRAEWLKRHGTGETK